jgi:drug/metabolite transporter (DMT)-like permease
MIAFILLAVIDAGAALLTSKGMKQVGEVSLATLEPSQLKSTVGSAIQTPPLLLGFGMEIFNFFLFLVLLSWADVSLVIPVMGSGSYLISIVGAKFFLKERVTSERWLGTILIVLGVMLISL